MKELKSILARNDGGYDVIFDEDGTARYACQVYDRDEPNHFTWAEVQAALPSLLDADPGPVPDPRTPEEKVVDRKREIAERLAELDREITRVEEDIVDKIGLELAPKRKASREEKVELRKELASL